jgi:DNA-binding MurR/RpiR family transcriptional regulator
MTVPEDRGIEDSMAVVLPTIRQKLDSMTPMQRKIARFVLEQPTSVIKMSITEFAAACHVKSEASIVKFYRTLGFSGYHDFKVNLATEIAGNTFYHTYSDITENDNMETIKEKIFQGGMQILHDNLTWLNTEAMEKAAEIIRYARRVIILGYAPSGVVAHHAFIKFSRLGLHCHYTQDSHINAMVMANPQEGDVIFCISQSGESKDLIIPVKHAKPPAKVIALTGVSDSHLSKIADVCITTISEELDYRTDAMLSRLVQSVVVDTLYTAIGLRSGQEVWEQLGKTKQMLSYLKY